MNQVFQDTVLWSLAETLIIVLVAAATAGGAGAKCAAKPAIAWTVFYNFILFYFLQPPQEGFLWGQGWTLVFAAICLIVPGFFSLATEERKKNLTGGTITLLALGLIAAELVLWTGTYASISWGAANAQNFSDLANIEIASTDEKLPETDPKDIVLVTSDIAHNLGLQELNGNGDNLGSLFTINLSEWVRQSVNGHLYYLAPLEYKNPLSQFGIFTKKIEASPGIMVVDAEDPNGKARLLTGDKLHFLPGAYFSQNLRRLIYQAGYTMIEKPQLEVDDSFHPYFTTAVLTPKFGVTGNVVKSVLVVDATTGEIKEYAPGQTPDWLDRVSSSDLVLELAFQWGLWSSKQSRDQWPNSAGQYQMTPVDAELVYNQKDIPVWLVPMRSHSGTSSTGILLYDTRINHGVFYPGLNGLGVGDTVTTTFENTNANVRSFPVDAVQLYSIYGIPTWVAVYTQGQGAASSSFAAVGLLDARHLNGANVIMAPDMETALSRYSNYLASGGGLTASEIAQSAKLETVSGRLALVGMSVQQSESIFYFVVDGDSRVFTSTIKVSRLLPLMREGDTVELRFLDSKTAELAITSIQDKDLNARLGLDAEHPDLVLNNAQAG